MRNSPWQSAFLVLTAAVGLAACRGTGRLDEYDFPGRTLAVAWVDAPYPQILTGPYFLDPVHEPVAAVIAAGTRIVKEVEASKARARLDSATERVDLTLRLGERTLERASRYLRTRPTDDTESADYVLEVRLRRYGIDAKEWHAAAHFFVDAELSLIDGRDGTLIWDSRVRSRDSITPAVFGPGTVVRDAMTAAAFANLSVEEMVQALERLADYSSDELTERLRDALQAVRREPG